MTNDLDYGAFLADLRAKRDQLDSAIKAIEAIVGAQAKSAPALTLGDIPSDAFFGMSVIDAAVKYLRMTKKPATPTEIAEAIEMGGFTHQSKNLSNTIYTTLDRASTRDDVITKVGRRWGLAEWYPGRRTVKRLRATNGDDASLAARVTGGAQLVDYDEDEENTRVIDESNDAGALAAIALERLHEQSDFAPQA